MTNIRYDPPLLPSFTFPHQQMGDISCLFDRALVNPAHARGSGGVGVAYGAIATTLPRWEFGDAQVSLL